MDNDNKLRKQVLFLDNPEVKVDGDLEHAIKNLHKRFTNAKTLKLLKLRKNYVTTKERRKFKRRIANEKFKRD